MGSDPFLDALDAQAGPSAPSAAPPLDGVMSRIAAAEGTGQNPRSSARGVGQFTDATLLGTYKKHYPNAGLSDQQILALKDDPATMNTMLGHLVQDNSEALSASGHDPTPGNVYLAHWFGQAGANSILSADPSTPIASIVGASVVKANPNIAGLTAGQVAAMTAQKMGGDAPAPVQQADPNDPFLAAFDTAIEGHAGILGEPLAAAPVGAGSYGVQPPNGGGGGAGNDDRQGAPAGRGRLSLISSFDPALDSLVNGTNYLGNVQDRLAGLVHGAASVPETMMHTAAWVTDKSGAHGSADLLRKWSDKLDSVTANLAHDPSSNNFAVGKFGGEVGALAPLSEIAPFSAVARANKAGKIASALARYGDLAAQGAAGGALTSKGENVGEGALTGAVLAPALGATAEKLLPVVLKGVDAVASSRIAKAISERLAAGDAARVAPAAKAEIPNAATQTIRKSADLPAGWSADDMARGWRRGADGKPEFAPEAPQPKSGVKIDVAKAGGKFPGGQAPMPGTSGAQQSASPEVSAYVDAYLAGKGRGSTPADLEMQQFAANHAKEIEQEFTSRGAASRPAAGADYAAPEPAQASQASPSVAAKSRLDPGEVGRALGSHGARSGLEAFKDLPPAVEAHYLRLRMQGVPADQAVREADILNAGGKPTIAAVTRNPEDQAATWEGAKEPTTEGRALSAQIAQNNAAVLNKTQSMIEANGGVPHHGEAAETAAMSLAKASDAEKANVGAAYKAARDAEGDQTVSIDSLRELLAKPEYRAPTDAASRELIGGMNTLVKEMGKTNGNRFTPDQIESLRQSANAAYDRMGGSVNSKIGAIKAALDDSLDQLEKAGPAYKAARTAHKSWAAAYENPEGISKLIRRDAQGNFANADNWRSTEGFVTSAADKHFVQIARQLKANGDTQAVARLKASILQRAYEKATNNAQDRLGNATMSGKLFFDALNGVGKAKLEAVFSPAELAEIASIGRAARALNEAVPGTNNTSNTASALAKALRGDAHKGSKLKTGLRVAGHVAGAATGHFGGNIAVEGIHRGAGYISKRGQAKALAEALRESMNPGAARSAERARAQRMGDALRRHRVAKAAAAKMSPVTGPLDSRHRS